MKIINSNSISDMSIKYQWKFGTQIFIFIYIYMGGVGKLVWFEQIFSSYFNWYFWDLVEFMIFILVFII